MPPAHSFFENRSILENILLIWGNLFFSCYQVEWMCTYYLSGIIQIDQNKLFLNSSKGNGRLSVFPLALHNCSFHTAPAIYALLRYLVLWDYTYSLSCKSYTFAVPNQQFGLKFQIAFSYTNCLLLIGAVQKMRELCIRLKLLVLPQFSWKTEFVLLAKEPGIDAKNQLAKYQKTVVLVQFN